MRESGFCHTEKVGSKVKNQEPDQEPLGWFTARDELSLVILCSLLIVSSALNTEPEL